MPRRKAKKVVKRTEEAKNDDKSEREIQREEEKKKDFEFEEIERQMAAVRAIRDVEIEHTLTALSLLRSYFTKEQRQSRVLEFFKENLPDLSVAIKEESGEIELKWNDSNCDSSLVGNADGVVDLNYSILKRLSMGFPDLYNSRPSLGGYDNVRGSLLGTDNTHLENLVFQGPSENQMLASHDALRTPVVNGQRLSFGMTPKTRRQPKPGEMMLSVDGSPLGVFKEDDNMGTINEENS